MEVHHFSLDPINSSLSSKHRIRFYENLDNFIKRRSSDVSKLNFNGEVAINLANAIKKDISSSNENLKKTSLNLLSSIILNLNLMDGSAWGFLSSMLLKDSKNNSPYEHTKEAMMTSICNRSFHLSSASQMAKNDFHPIKRAIIEITYVIPKKNCRIFFKTEIVPVMFDSNASNDVRDEIIEVGMHLVDFVNILDYTLHEESEFLSEIIDKYINIVGEFRDLQYNNWYKLWIILVRICNRKLHTIMTLANKLLRVVEVAFRNSTSASQRLQAYDCWKELIDNCSLDMEFMCSPKQIRLLATPLKAKFSRMQSVIDKRFETFVYLLEKLKDKSTLCLQDFLEFCFGPFLNSPEMQKMKQVRRLPALSSAKALIAIVGHGHSHRDCISYADVINLSKPVIDESIFPKYSQVLFSSVVECCLQLTDVEKLQRQSIMSCLFGSLLNFIQKSDNVTKRTCAINLGKTLDSVFTKSDQTEISRIFLGCVCEVIVMKKLEDVLNVKEEIFTIAITLLGQVPLENCPFDVNIIETFISECLGSKSGDDALNYQNLVSECFSDDSKWVNNSALCKIWPKCFYSDLSYLIWPIKYLDHFENEEFESRWTDVYKVHVRDETVKLQLLTQIDEISAANPLMSTKIVRILEMISMMEHQASKEYIERFIKTVEGVVSYLKLPNDDLKILVGIVTKYLDYICLFCQSDKYDDALKELCKCIEQITFIHKNFTLLLKLELTLKLVEKRTLEKFATYLTPFLTELLKLNETEGLKPAKKILRLLEMKDEVKDAVLPPLNTPRTKKLDLLIDQYKLSTKKSPNCHSVNLPAPTSSPVMNLRGSQLRNLMTAPITTRTGRILAETTKSTKKKSSFLHFDDDSSSDYVKIDTKVDFNPEKLSEHQKEVLKRRREDIPALYQDLSQSVSNSVDFSSNIKEQKKDEKLEFHFSDSSSNLRRSSPRLSSPIKSSPPLQCSVVVENIKDKISPEFDGKLSALRCPSDNEIDNLSTVVESQIKKKLFDDEPSAESSRTNGNATDCSLNASEQSIKILRRSVRGRRGKPRKLQGKKAKNENVKATENEDLAKDKEDDDNLIKLPENFVIVDSTNSADKVLETTGNDNSEVVPNVENDAESTNNNQKRSLSLQKGQDPDEPKAKQRKLSLNNVDKKDNRNRDESVNAIGSNLRPRRKRVTRGNCDFIWDVNASAGRPKVIKKTRRSDPTNPKIENAGDADGKSESEKKVRKVVSSDPKTRRSKTDRRSDLQALLSKAKKVSKELDSLSGEGIAESEQRDDYNFDSNKDVAFQWKPKSGKSGDTSPTKCDVGKENPADNLEQIVNSDPSDSQTTADLTIMANQDGVSDSFHSYKATRETMSPINLSPVKQQSVVIDRPKSPIKNVSDERPKSPIKNWLAERPKSPIKNWSAERPKSPFDCFVKISPVLNENGPPSDDTFGDLIESSQAAVTRRKTRSLTFSSVTKPAVLPILKEGSKSADSSPLKTSAIKDLKSWLLPAPPAPSQPETEELFTSSSKNVSISTTLTNVSEIKNLIPLDTQTQQQPELNDSAKEMDAMSTETPRSDTSTSSLTLSAENAKDLRSSPITCDTPERNVKFLADTSDISPINSQQHVDTENVSEDVTMMAGARSSKLLQMVNAPSPILKLNRWKTTPRSPSVSKIRLSRRKKGADLRRMDVLTFSREIPSPLTQPRSSILKRKSRGMDDFSSPAAKRKRVNFSDPAISEQKVFLTDPNEFEKFEPEVNPQQPCASDGDDDVFGDDIDPFETNKVAELIENLTEPLPENNNLMSVYNFLNRKNVSKIVGRLFEDGSSVSDVRSKLHQIANDLAEILALVNVIDDFLLEPDSDLAIFVVKLGTVVENLLDLEFVRFVNKLVEIFGVDQILQCFNDVNDVSNLKVEDFKESFDKFVGKLDDGSRDDFLLWTMKFAGEKLTPNVQSLKRQIELLHEHVNKIGG